MGLTSYTVIDDFCADPEGVRASALASGFGRWTPNKGLIGSSVYDGLCYVGRHSDMIHALTKALGFVILPEEMFFRASQADARRAYIHSDRSMGAFTCVTYLSEHGEEEYGTAFWRHRATGLEEMPPVEELRKPEFEQLRADMVSGESKDWERRDFVRGKFNRALVFRAPLFHSRVPFGGIGSNDDDARIIWGCHFHTPATLPVWRAES